MAIHGNEPLALHAVVVCYDARLVVWIVCANAGSIGPEVVVNDITKLAREREEGAGGADHVGLCMASCDFGSIAFCIVCTRNDGTATSAKAVRN
jgi:hypothetical protein